MIDNEDIFFTNRTQIENVFIEHFKCILAPKDLENDLLHIDLSTIKVQATLDVMDGAILKRPIDLKELVDAIKFSSPNKSPCLDGFHSHFFKVCWLTVGEDIVAGITYFLKHGRLLKQIKNTFIALVPKKENSTYASDYRPIALTNEIYKIIGRIIAHRMKPFIDKSISPTQSAFIPGRSIADNILLSQALVKIFHRAKGKQCMCLRLDLSKAFDSINWPFVKAALHHLNFPKNVINCIMACISELAFSILANGKSCGFFNSTRGLRQGCPLSQYIFCIVMEFFSATLNEYAFAGLSPTPYTSDNLQISHLLYVDDLMLFSYATAQVVVNIKNLSQQC